MWAGVGKCAWEGPGVFRSEQVGVGVSRSVQGWVKIQAATRKEEPLLPKVV